MKDFLELSEIVVLKRESGSYVNYGYVKTQTESNIQAVIQPIDGKKLERLPEGERECERLTVFTSTRLQVRDILVIDSIEYQVEVVEMNRKVIEHFECIARRLTE